ncbi:hypothetical protein K504DRAFT_457662 [Pleomassaria siparia CBS 279.74]|uniref:INO80 complex subunit F domain-containing protein n=1 Tax=Pleomassaria siparia CBS 279.74 TaxID=1314801 RepID=A0A6G1KRI7_9PLEO|nr:hypothetical protein K504DRAFT_457662 [Pleomassaria siparia CBS 279.74]
MPQSGTAVRVNHQKDLPPSVETAYYRKCIELRRRINDIEENNDGTRLRIKRYNRSIQKMRLERAFLLEQLHKHMEYNVDDSDRSSSPPPTPTDKPLRSKRSHRKNTPPPGTQLGGMPGGQHASPGSHQIPHALNPMSSAQSTPDPSSRPNPFFTSIPPVVTSPHAVNGTAQPPLPSLHSLPPLQRPPEPSRYFDAVYDEQRTDENDADFAGRRRAHSSAHPPPPAPPVETREVQNGDTEMGNAPSGGFTAVNTS